MIGKVPTYVADSEFGETTTLVKLLVLELWNT